MKHLIYLSYDHYDSDVKPEWVRYVREAFPDPDSTFYDPYLSFSDQSLSDEHMQDLEFKYRKEFLPVLGLPEILASPYSEILGELADAQEQAQRGFVTSMLLVQHYMLLRSSLVIVDGDATFGSGPATELLLASQMRLPTILVCNRSIQPPWMLAFADVSVTTTKLPVMVDKTLTWLDAYEKKESPIPRDTPIETAPADDPPDTPPDLPSGD